MGPGKMFARGGIFVALGSGGLSTPRGLSSVLMPPAVAGGVLRVAILQEEPRFAIALLMHIVPQLRMRITRQGALRLVQPAEKRAQVRRIGLLLARDGVEVFGQRLIKRVKGICCGGGSFGCGDAVAIHRKSEERKLRCIAAGGSGAWESSST